MSHRGRFPLNLQAYVNDLLSDRPVFPSESFIEESLDTSYSNHLRFRRGAVLNHHDSPGSAIHPR